ncbi:MAG: lipid A export permease/ATP-binding protein MsbA [Gammaproteobacteria bacterium]|nr:lipid A export permease/ATP-binding protein MsbA [Gammaproteobacteria bacterium]
MSQEVSTSSSTQIYKRLLGYVKRHKGVFAIAILGMAISATTEAGFAALMKTLMDDSFVAKDPQMIVLAPLLLLLLFVVRGISAFMATYFLEAVSSNVIKKLREELFEKFLLLPSRYYDANSSGQLLSKLVYDTEQVTSATGQAITTLVQDSFRVIALLAWMFYLNWILSLTFIVLTPVLAVLVVLVSKRFRKLSRRIQNSMGDVTHVSEEIILGQKVIKIFGGQRYEKQHFTQVNDYNRLQKMKMVATQAISVNFIQFLVAGALAAIIYVATLPAMKQDVTVGTFVSFMFAMMMLLPAARNLTNINASLQRGIAAAGSIFGLLDQKIERDDGTRILTDTKGSIDFEKVNFSYDQNKGNVLDDISLHIEAGETVAFVGRSGSGKSTLVSLLPRFYDVKEGVIKVDGHNINELRLESLRDHVALVSQEVVLFNDSIRRNIAYGKLSECSNDEIEAAAKAAHVTEYVNKLPDGFDTMVGEGGALLSGGQRQRLAIARAILKDAPILILDEATSALDNESERHIQAALEVLMQNRTTLVIAHRLSTIEGADKIVVMDNGRIVETGTHKELLDQNGYYAELYRLQFND